MTLPDYISVKEAAALIGVTPRTIANYRQRGVLKSRRLPSRTVPRFRLFRQSVVNLAKIEA